MNLQRDNGVAMVIAMMALLLMTALGVALILNTSSETTISSNYRSGSEGLYAADAIIERAMDDLLTVANWNQLLTGSVQSAFVDGPPSGVRTLADGSTLALSEAVNMANCGKTSECSASDLTGNATGDRPWAANNPVWQLYAYGPLADMIPTGTINSPFYVVLMVADDPSEDDGQPLHDGLLAGNPGRGVIALRAEAFGPRGAHKTIEVTVSRTDTIELERGYTGQRGQDEQNRRDRKAPAQSSGGGLTMTAFDLSGGIR
jgi:Tfp pilus assembly protein PilX